ncbi:MAG: hypothetical protein BWY68_00522 [bacterium ADurb.Bin400]|nr:MAG: hypothetical protein BWY68_00522 [bacterium ADurb.Bin400]
MTVLRAIARTASATALLVTLFWALVLFIIGTMPTTNIWGYHWPRWWDVLIGPVWSVIVTPLLLETTERHLIKTRLKTGLIIGIAIAIISVFSAWISGYSISLVIEAVLAIAAATIISQLSKTNKPSWDQYADFAIGLMLSYGIVASLAFGLPFALVAAPVAYIIAWGYYWWPTINTWLTGK